MNDFLKYKINIISLAGFKGIQILSTLILTHILISSFGKNDYAIFVVILSFGQLVMIDTGASEAVKKNLLMSKDYPHDKVIFNGLIITTLSSVITITLFYVLIFLSDPETINGYDYELWMVLFISTLIMPLKISREVFTAYHETYKHSLLMIACICTSIIYSVLLGVDDFIEAIMIQHGVLLIGNGLSILYLYKDKGLQFRLQLFDIDVIKKLMPDTVKFLLLGLSLMLINGADIVLLSSLGIDNEELTEFSLVLRIYIYIHTVFMLLIYPSLPLLSSLYQSDYSKYLIFRGRLSFAIVFGSGLTLFIFCLLLPNIISIWVGIVLTIPYKSVIFIAMFTYFRLLSDYFDYLLRSENIVNKQVFFTLIEAILHIMLSILGWNWDGLIGFSLGILVATLFSRTLPFLFFIVRNTKNKSISL
ncbi:hypothetical protein PE36_06302 [Moritella sp. PE36]|uniref:lipopolysaccharide biosynthesis protein n=1 Tax=Moritella sp. PE36 TaxID=58051 RepID=UPI0001568316|nr:hypothetical protein [Moritella sp. PE36]EDM69075.1 hypothetical protein PE36_06302 [Moritella sp. PE36]